MSALFPAPPATGTPMPATRPNAGARDLLALRRSASSKALTTPGPAPDALDDILKVAARVPDHRKLEPWRFIVFEGEARTAFGQKIEARFLERHPDADADTLKIERNRFLRAPVIVAVISSVNPEHKTPVWEQELSAGALCQNLLLAANAAGWAGAWLTEWLAFDDGISADLGLGDNERVAGFIYLGTASCENPERPRPDMRVKVTRFPT